MKTRRIYPNYFIRKVIQMNSTQSSLFIGCDVSSDVNFFSFLLQDGTSVGSANFPNNVDGTNKLIELIFTKLNKFNCSSFLFGVEATSNYHTHLLRTIAASKLNLDFDMHLYQLNAQLVRNFKKAYPIKSKTDKYDAYIIAERLRFGNLPEEFIPFDKYEPLRRLTRARFHIIKMIEKETNYFLSILFIKFSEYKKMPFSKTLGNTSSTLITEFDLQDIEDISIGELVDFLIIKSKNRFQDPEAYAIEVKKVVRNCYRIEPKLNDAINTILAISLENIKAFKKSLNTINKSITKEFSLFQCTLNSIPGIGVIYAASILSEIGSRHFSNDGKLAKFAGITWFHKESNKFSSEETRMTKAGNIYLRYYLLQAANSVKNYCYEFGIYYHKKYNEVNKHQHKRAIALSARKLIRVIFILLRDKTLYDPSRYLNATGGDS
jgi:transposase